MFHRPRHVACVSLADVGSAQTSIYVSLAAEVAAKLLF